ncbi:MAG: sigma 54-interacting transcriptional regulator [Polyangiaceae bacterium]
MNKPEISATQTVEDMARSQHGAKMGAIVVVSGAEVGRVIPIRSGAAISLGRDESADVVLADPGLSRKHAQVQSVAGQYLLRDLGSRNGTFVNGERVDFAAPLAEGDRVRLGQSITLQFLLVDAAAERSLENTFEASHKTYERLVSEEKGAPAPPAVGGPIVTDPVMHAVYKEARRAAQSNLTILLLGETGAGKDVLARAIHMASPRAKKPYLAINCAAISETLLESEIFGHEKGAFTGAATSRAGLLESADGGTVFLDEIGELPLSIQVKLLRVLEDRTVLRVGGRSAKAVDVRFVAATNRDLLAEIDRNTFRRDLYYRLAGITLRVPPLRERKSDIATLAASFAEAAARSLGRKPPILSPETVGALQSHDFPGNVRELKNLMERAVVMSSASVLLPSHLGELGQKRPPSAPPVVAARAAAPAAEGAGGALKDQLDDLERTRILAALDECGGNQSRAAEKLGMSRRTLVARLSAWGMTRPRTR